MKTIMAVFLFLISTSSLADKPPWVVRGNPNCSDPPCEKEVPVGGGKLIPVGQGSSGSQSNGIASIPEPSTLALMGLGAAGLVFVRRRKR